MAARKPKDGIVTFKVGEDSYEINASALSLGETAEVEVHFGIDFEDLTGSPKTLALLYLAIKRKKPNTTWDEVGAYEWRNLDVNSTSRPTTPPANAGTPPS